MGLSRANQPLQGNRLPRRQEKRLVCRSVPVPKRSGRGLRLGAENQRPPGKSANPPRAQRSKRPAKAKPAKRAALAGRDRRDRGAVAKPKAPAAKRRVPVRYHVEQSVVRRNRVALPQPNAAARHRERRKQSAVVQNPGPVLGPVALGERSTKSAALILVAM